MQFYQVPTESGLDRFAKLIDLQRKQRSFECLNHDAALDLSEVTAIAGRARVLGKFTRHVCETFTIDDTVANLGNPAQGLVAVLVPGLYKYVAGFSDFGAGVSIDIVLVARIHLISIDIDTLFHIFQGYFDIVDFYLLRATVARSLGLVMLLDFAIVDLDIRGIGDEF